MATVALDLAIIFVVVVGLGLSWAFLMAVVDEFITNRQSPAQRAQGKVDRHRVERSRRDAELRTGMQSDAQEVRRQLRRELGDR
jgi:hypothetical protein